MIMLVQEIQGNQIKRQNAVKKIYSFAIILEVAILFMQWSDYEILSSLPLDPKEEDQEKSFLLNRLLTIFQLVLSIPYIFSMLCQLIIKIFSWPFDLKNFHGKCTFGLAYPDHLRKIIDGSVQKEYQNVHNHERDSVAPLNQNTVINFPFVLTVDNISNYDLNIRINQVAAAHAAQQQLAGNEISHSASNGSLNVNRDNHINSIRRDLNSRDA